MYVYVYITCMLFWYNIQFINLSGGNAEVARTLTYSDEDQQLEPSPDSDLCYPNGDISSE